jgi:hypothetical protein
MLMPQRPPSAGGTSIELLTAKENPSLGAGTLVVIARGPIAPPLLEELNRLDDEIRAHERLILDLDSPGGELSYAESVAASLQSIRADVDLTTYVRNGSRCLSSCVLAFLQGEERIAGGASAWLFHGVCHAFADLPLPRETKRFVSLMAGAGVSQEFLSLLESHITAPGEFWVSGYELYNVYRAGIITELLDPWRPMNPIFTAPPTVQ